MSENLDLVRSLYRDHFECGEFFGPAEWAHPEIECVLVDGPAPDSGSGVAGMARVWKGSLAAYEDSGTPARVRGRGWMAGSKGAVFRVVRA
jgi:hypothetical protein